MIWINPFQIAGGSLKIRVQLQGSLASDPAGTRWICARANSIYDITEFRVRDPDGNRVWIGACDGPEKRS